MGWFFTQWLSTSGEKTQQEGTYALGTCNRAHKRPLVSSLHMPFIRVNSFFSDSGNFKGSLYGCSACQSWRGLKVSVNERNGLSRWDSTRRDDVHNPSYREKNSLRKRSRGISRYWSPFFPPPPLSFFSLTNTGEKERFIAKNFFPTKI